MKRKKYSFIARPRPICRAPSPSHNGKALHAGICISQCSCMATSSTQGRQADKCSCCLLGPELLVPVVSHNQNRQLIAIHDT